MRAETALAAAIGVVVVTSLVVAALVPGALAGPETEPGHARVSDATVAAGEVRADAVTLTVTAYLRHHGGYSENLSVRVRATHLESEIHAVTETVALDPVEGDREVEIPVDVTVPREGGYRMEVLLYRDGQRRDGVTRQVRGVGTLRPPTVRSPVEFHRFGGGNQSPNPVQAAVDEDHGDEVTLKLSTYLTNERGGQTDDLEVEFRVRHAGSGLVEAATRVPVGEVESGRTATPSATLRVADGYNYYVDAFLWKDGAMVGEALGVANLGADRPLQVDDSDRGAGLKVEDGGGASGMETPTRARSPTGEPTPGFGVGVALAALAGATLFAYTRRQP